MINDGKKDIIEIPNFLLPNNNSTLKPSEQTKKDIQAQVSSFKVTDNDVIKIPEFLIPASIQESRIILATGCPGTSYCQLMCEDISCQCSSQGGECDACQAGCQCTAEGCETCQCAFESDQCATCQAVCQCLAQNNQTCVECDTCQTACQCTAMSNQCTGQCSTCQSECQCLAESNQCGTCQTCQCSTQSNQTPTPVVTISKTGSTTTSISCSVSVANGTATRYQWIVGQSLVAETTSSSYTFTMLNCGANYYCQVIAYNGSTLLDDDSNWFTTSACPAGVSVYMNDNGETFIDAGASYPGGRTWKWYIGGVLKGTTSGTDSSSYHFGSLTCSNVYNISCSAYDGTGALLGSGSANIHTLDCPPNPRPDNFIWDTPKVAGQKFNLSAEEWVNFVSRIIGFRYYVLGDDTYNFTYPNPGDVFTAAMFNQAVTAIDDMSPPTSPPATIADPQPVDLNLRDKVTAARLNGLVASLNSIP